MKNYKKVIAGAVAIAISAGATTTLAFAKTNDGSEPDNSETAATAASDSTSSRTELDKAPYKDETVYVLCKNDSHIKKVIVSDWLQNPPALSILDDVTSLKDIENVKGEETFTTDSDNITWAADGKDIYYKGTTEKELPVDVTMKYFLDGKEVTPDSIIGKSGHLVIRWEYNNKTSVTRNVNGKDKEFKVPFIVASAALLNNEKFLNATISSGKVISDGNRLIVVGLAFPGLNQCLGLDAMEDIDIELPENVEFSADVTDFEMSNTVTAVSNELFSRLDFEEDFNIGNLKEKLTELSDGSKKLCDGTLELYNGINTLAEKSGGLTDGIAKLDAGALELKKGADSLSSGAAALSNGAKTVSDSTAKLRDGIKSAKEGSSKLNSGAAQLKTGAAELSSGVDKLVEGGKALSAGIDSAKKGSEQLVAGLADADKGSDELVAGAKQFANGASQLADGSAKLKSGSAVLADGAAKLNKGAETLSDSAGQLSDGINSAKNGADALSAGIDSVKTGAGSLKSGAASVADGAEKLHDGLGTASTSLSTTIAANEQALAALEALYAQSPSTELATTIGTLRKTIEAQKQQHSKRAPSISATAQAASTTV